VSKFVIVVNFMAFSQTVAQVRQLNGF